MKRNKHSKTRSFAIVKTLIHLMICFCITGFPMSAAPDIDPLWSIPITGGIYSLKFLPKPQIMPGVHYSGIEPEIWSEQLASTLFPANEIFMKSRDFGIYAEKGAKTINIPQAGTDPAVVKNRTSLPATAVKRTDTINQLSVDEYTTTPTLLQWTEELQASYAKRIDLLSAHNSQLITRMADEAAVAWAASLAANQVRTTGTARAALSPSATGTRSAVTRADIVEVHRLTGRMDIPDQGKIMLVPADLLADILKIDEFIHADKIGSSAGLTEGAIGRIFGFDVMTRSRNAVYDNTGTPVVKAVGAAGAATDNESILFFHPLYTARGVTDVKVFINEEDAANYGNILSALVLGGFKKFRTDGKGIVSLIETLVS